MKQKQVLVEASGKFICCDNAKKISRMANNAKCDTVIRTYRGKQ